MEELLNPVQQVTVEVVDIQFRPGQKNYFLDTARATNHPISVKDVVSPLRKILRKATSQDEKINAEYRSRERRAY